MTIYPLYKMMDLKTLTKSGFRDFIHSYKTLPRRILADYGFDSVDELPTDNHKLAFIDLEGWYTDMEKCLRVVLLDEKEHETEYKDGLLKKYRFFATETEKYYELIQVILKSGFGKSYILLWKDYIDEIIQILLELDFWKSHTLLPLPLEHWKYYINQLIQILLESDFGNRQILLPEHWKESDILPLEHLEDCIAKTLFCISEIQSCESNLLDLGILGNDPKPIMSKAKLYKISQFLRNYFEEGKPSKIFQRNDAGKLVDTNTLKVPEFDITRFVLREPTEPLPTFYLDAYPVPEPDYIFSSIIYLAILGRYQDTAIADAMEDWTKAKDSRTNDERRNKELKTFRVKDGSLIFGQT